MRSARRKARHREGERERERKNEERERERKGIVLPDRGRRDAKHHRENG